MTNLKRKNLHQEIIKEFKEKFPPEWWLGFGGDMELNVEPIETIKSFWLSALTRVYTVAVEEGYNQAISDILAKLNELKKK